MTIHRRAPRTRERAVGALRAELAAPQAGPAQAVETPARRAAAQDRLVQAAIPARPAEAGAVPRALPVIPVLPAQRAPRATQVAELMVAALAGRATEDHRRRRTAVARSTRFNAEPSRGLVCPAIASVFSL